MTTNRSQSIVCTALTWIFAILVGGVVIAPVRAQLPHTRLDSMFPSGGKVGTKVEVTLVGGDLDDVDRLTFSHSGVSATPKTKSLSESFPDPQPVPGEFLIQIADNVPPGLYEMRAAGHFGVSNPRWFHVDRLENVTETTDNSVAEKAMPVLVGTTVSGRADADRIDYFRVAVKAGERITIDCLAGQIDSRLDAALVLHDSSGREIARDRNSQARDPVLAFAAPADGEYTLAVHDFLYRGGNDYFYRLSVHRGPHLTHVFPPSVLPDTATQVTLFGYNLPGGKPTGGSEAGRRPLEQLAVNLQMSKTPELFSENQPGKWLHPACSMLDGWLYRLDSPAGISNPLLIGSAQAPVVVESEPNNAGQQATAVTVPCEFVGHLSPRGDRDWAAFQASAGQRLWIEVISHRLGSPCDPVLHVEKVTVNAQGEEQVTQITTVDDTDPAASNDPTRLLRARSGDPVYRLAVDQDATYRVQLRDLYGSPVAGEPMIYRLVIREQQPDFRLVAYPLPPDQRDRNKVFTSSPVLRRGGTVAFGVRCFREHGFVGDIEVSVDGLPTGVSCRGATLGGKTDETTLVLAAEEDAPAWVGTVNITGRATIGDQQFQRAARTAAVVAGSDNLRDKPWIARLTQQIGLSVIESETAVASLQAGAESVFEMSIGGKLEVPIRVTRRGEFAPAGNPVARGLPGQIQVKPSPLNNDGGKVELNLTNNQIPPGTYTFYVRAPVKQKRVRNATAIATAEQEAKRFEQLVQEKTEQLGTVTDTEKPQAELILKETQQFKATADKRLTDVRNANKERDYTFELISTPARLRVYESPVTLTFDPGTIVIGKGKKAPLNVSVQRKFGFDDKVDLTLAAPPGVAGVSAQPIAIDKGQPSVTVEVSANDQAQPGTYAFTLTAKMKFNNVNVEEKQPLTIRVED